VVLVAEVGVVGDDVAVVVSGPVVEVGGSTSVVTAPVVGGTVVVIVGSVLGCGLVGPPLVIGRPVIDPLPELELPASVSFSGGAPGPHATTPTTPKVIHRSIASEYARRRRAINRGRLGRGQ